MKNLSVIFLLSGILIFLFLLIRLVKYSVRKKIDLKPWADAASIFGTLATAFSLIWAAYTYFDGVQQQRDTLANDLYKDQLKLSIEHPEFSNPKTIPETPDSSSRDTAAIKKYEQYRWYMGYTFYTFESILTASGNDPAWQNTMKGFIKGHREYIVTDSIKIDRFSKEMRTLVCSIFPACKACGSAKKTCDTAIKKTR
jgi:hypothetical protein